MAGDTLAVRDKVQRYLVDLFGSAEVDGDGDLTFRQGSVQVWVSVRPFHEANTAVVVFAFPLLNAPASPELFRHVAMDGSFVFGHLTCHERDDVMDLRFSHTLLGETLDPEEFKVAVYMVAGLADKMSADLKARFGGRAFHED